MVVVVDLFTSQGHLDTDLSVRKFVKKSPFVLLSFFAFPVTLHPLQLGDMAMGQKRKRLGNPTVLLPFFPFTSLFFSGYTVVYRCFNPQRHIRPLRRMHRSTTEVQMLFEQRRKRIGESRRDAMSFAGVAVGARVRAHYYVPWVGGAVGFYCG